MAGIKINGYVARSSTELVEGLRVRLQQAPEHLIGVEHAGLP